jgi:hypothetical protein
MVSYHMGREAAVSIRIYNLLGMEVAVLVNGTRAAGVHSVLFDASALPSGKYLVKLATATDADALQIYRTK